MPILHFHKMEGAGNDFVVLDNFQYGLSLDKIIEITPRLCNRRFGIGADGLMVLQPAERSDVDFTMIYRNADGSDAGMCGNGSRCLAVFAGKKGLGEKLKFNVHDAIYEATVDGESAEISFPDVHSPVPVSVGEDEFLQIYSGTEHVVKLTDKSILENESELLSTGAHVRADEQFKPNGTNVNFIYIQDEDHLHLQTFEKGVEGLTLACGTGAIASAIAAHSIKSSNNDSHTYSIKVKGGKLGVSFKYQEKKKVYSNVKLKGPARFVFEGDVKI